MGVVRRLRWFKGKTAIEDEDASSITIRCIDNFTADWLQEYYTSLVEGISGKKVSFNIHPSQKEDTLCLKH